MDLSLLRPLYPSGPGRWCSVYLDTARDREDAATAIDLRWRGLAEALREQGAEEADLSALDGAVHADRGSGGLALFAADGKVALTVPLPQPPPRDAATVSTLPHALPLAAQLDERVAWLRALVDRTGADLLAVPADGPPRTARVEDGDYPLRKAAPGGWSQPRYQRAAEENWDRTAARISEEAAALARQVHARVLLVAGDVRERGLVADRLAEDLPKTRVVQTDAGSRAEGAAPGPLEEATQSVVREEAARLRGDALDAYRREMGRHGAAVAGLADVVSALREAKVDTLLVSSVPDRPLWAGSEPGQLALTEDELRTMGVTEPWQADASDVLLRAAAATEADLLVVSPDEAPLADGVGAHLRY